MTPTLLERMLRQCSFRFCTLVAPAAEMSTAGAKTGAGKPSF